MSQMNRPFLQWAAGRRPAGQQKAALQGSETRRGHEWTVGVQDRKGLLRGLRAVTGNLRKCKGGRNMRFLPPVKCVMLGSNQAVMPVMRTVRNF